MSKKRIAVITVFLIIGLLLIFSGQISNYYLKYKGIQAKELLKNEVTADKIKENSVKDSNKNAFDFSQVKPLSAEDNLKAPPQFDMENVLGIINIPKKSLYMPIYRGVDNVNLKTGAGTLRADQKMGVGNYTLAGHHNHVKGVLFNEVPELESGDKVYITDKEFIYTYKVYSVERVPETNVGLIEDVVAERRGNPVLSLLTCFSWGETDERIFAFCDFVSKEPFDKAKFDSLKE